MICTYCTNTANKCSMSRKKFIEIEKTDQQALEKFLNKLRNINITDHLNLNDNADPNLNFTIFMEHFMNLKQESMFSKEVSSF